MQYILMILCLVVTVGVMVFIKSLELSSGLTAVLVIPSMFTVIYFLAKIQASAGVAERKAVKE